MSTYFHETLAGWDDWARVFSDVEAFRPLVQAIYAKEGMGGAEEVSGLTPGTNAVFRCGNTVVKIYAPIEVGVDMQRDFEVELAMLRHVKALGIPASDLLASGEIADTYRFRYLILGYVQGKDVRTVLGSYSPEQKRTFARYMRALSRALHKPCEDLLPPVDLKARARENERLAQLPETLRADILRRLDAMQWETDVVVHGDMTDDNILMTGNGTPVLIDFADSVCGPEWYEWAALVFELLRCDREMVRTFAGDMPVKDFVARLMDAVALHDFGADILRDYARREGISLADIPTLHALGERLYGLWR